MIGVELLFGQNLVEFSSLFQVRLLNSLTTIPCHDEKRKPHIFIFHPVHLIFKMCSAKNINKRYYSNKLCVYFIHDF